MLETNVVGNYIGAPVVTYDYRETLDTSVKVNWKLEDVIGGDKKLDFSKRFMPESLARVEELSFLTEHEKTILNQIKGNTYLTIFGIVEEFIVPFVLDHVRPSLNEDDYRVRALLQFVGEEVKHIQLFKLFCDEFRQNFGSECKVIGPAADIGKAVLAHDPLSVALVILVIEWTSQAHYIDSIKDDNNLDPLFKSLLRNHWMEEAQHAKLDTRMVEHLAEGLTAEQIEKAVDGFFSIGELLDNGLKQQTEFELEAFELATGRTLTENERKVFRERQLQSNRWTFIGTGMVNQKFLQTMDRLGVAQRKRINEAAPIFS
ncbi:MAG TPA: diiron oxygenase [Pyrinomonadaceae bacterium]|nr:diiron oxygenase [Pyrinomonadaceae bacterium]